MKNNDPFPLGFIGLGVMAGAMIRGICRAGMLKREEILAFDIDTNNLNNKKAELGISAAADNKTVASQCGVIIVAVKPQQYPGVLQEISPVLTPDKILVSISPGQTFSTLAHWVKGPVKIIRAMPNTPALAESAMSGLCRNERVSDEEFDFILALFSCFGKAEEVYENQMDGVLAVSGSGPAYVYMFIEALADGAVAEGMTRQAAVRFAAQTVYGAAAMVMETDQHPAALKDMVCTPGGTTIEAVRVLEEKGFRSAVLQAMKAAADKARRMKG